MPKLANALAAGGYSLASVRYNKSDEKFGLAEKLIDENEKPVVNRYSFDVRV